MLTPEDTAVILDDGCRPELAAHYRRLNEDLLRRYPDGVRPSWVSEELVMNEEAAKRAEKGTP